MSATIPFEPPAGYSDTGSYLPQFHYGAFMYGLSQRKVEKLSMFPEFKRDFNLGNVEVAFNISVNMALPPSQYLSEAVPMGFYLDSPILKKMTADERVLEVLSRVFDRPEYSDLQFVCDFPELNREFPKGMDVVVYFRSDVEKKQRTPDDWKKLLLTCWRMLKSGGVNGIGYHQIEPVEKVRVAPVGGAEEESAEVSGDESEMDLPLKTEAGLYSPFWFPESSPLKTVQLTRRDLERHNFPSDWVAEISTNVSEPTLKNAHAAQVNEHFKTLVAIIQDQNFWKARHHSGDKIPKGVAQLQAVIAKYSAINPDLLASQQDIWKEFKSIASKRLALPTFGRRDSITDSLYRAIIENNVQLGTLGLNQHARRVYDAHQIAQQGAALMKAQWDRLRTLILNKSWILRHSQPALQKAPTGLARMQEKMKTHVDYDSQTLRELQMIARSRLNTPRFFGKRSPLAKEIYQVVSKFHDPVDLLNDDGLEKIQATLGG